MKKEMSMKYIIFGLFMFIGLSTGSRAEPLKVVDFVEIDKYLGTWYEIARFQNSFQKKCAGDVTATYSLREDGDLRVVNKCRTTWEGEEYSESVGKAWVVDETTNAKLKVQFFWPFRGDYWIIGLGENYDYAVVGHPDRDYLWILSRTPEMDPVLYEELLGMLILQGYDINKLNKTVQTLSGEF